MMSVHGARSAWRLAVLLAAVALIVGAVACGSDDGGDGGGDSAAASQDAASGSAGDGGDEKAVADVGGAEERDIAARVNRVQRAILKGDSALICKNFTTQARREAAKRSRKGTCTDNFDQIAAARVKGAEFPKVVTVKIDGDEADVTLRENDGRTFPVKVLKQGGEWKLDLVNPAQSVPPTVKATPSAPQG
jgi:hypothetical protein